MKGRLMTERMSKERPGTTKRLDHLKDFVDGQDIMVFTLTCKRVDSSIVGSKLVWEELNERAEGRVPCPSGFSERADVHRPSDVF